MPATNGMPSLPAGFRFHPTDEELIVHCLMNQAAPPSHALCPSSPRSTSTSATHGIFLAKPYSGKTSGTSPAHGTGSTRMAPAPTVPPDRAIGKPPAPTRPSCCLRQVRTLGSRRPLCSTRVRTHCACVFSLL